MKTVYVVVYHELEDGYVGMDVFGKYSMALKQFEKIYQETMDLHSNDPGWIEELHNGDDCQLYFRTKNGYEVFVRAEIVN